MMPAILWKEYREHRMVWTALACVGAASVLSLSRMAGAGWFGAHPGGQEGRFVAVALVGVYALICGAMMLAGEIENRTMPYLDALPGFRRRLWQGKFFAGVLLVTGQIVLLMGLGAAVSLFESWSEAGWTFAGMLLAGICGLSWGLLFSSLGRSVMSVILLSLAGLVLLGFATGYLAVFFTRLVSAISGTDPTGDPSLLWIGFYAIIAPTALVGSAFVFTRLDRSRLRAVPESLRTQGRAFHASWSMLFWLTWRQARGFATGLAAFALFLGFIVLLQSLTLWPMVTLVVGVLCGATAFADEQQGSFRFLGDQRLPLGRLWVAKVGVRFGIAVVAALLVLAPSFVAALANISESRWNYPEGEYHFFAHVFHSNILVDLCPPLLFLSLWLVYGFCSGYLFGLLFRHGLAAGVFALFTCSLTAALWIPSLLGGGLHAWQVFGPPFLLLIATRLLMRPWAAGRIASWTTAVRLTPFVVLACLWIAGGLWYRVLEIPNVSPKIDLDAFRASLPTPEQDEGGRLFHSACLRFWDQHLALQSQQMPQGVAPGAMGGAMAPVAPGLAPPAGAGGIPGMAGLPPMLGADDGQPVAPPLMEMERARNALEHGWPADDHALAVWLDKLYAGEWAPMLKKAADLPTGPFDDVRNMTALTLIPATQYARDVAVVLAVRGLQRQAAGDDEAYVENLRIGLALSRSMRDQTPAIDLLVGRGVERILLTGQDRWLEKLHGRPDLIRQALALLSRHLDETAKDGKDQEAIEAFIGRNTLDNPLSMLQEVRTFRVDQPGQTSSLIRDEAVWIATAWLVPWEHARQDRIFHVLFDGDQKQQRWLIERRNELGPLPQFGPNDIMRSLDDMRNLLNKPGELCDARVMQLKLALRWYQADNGKPAENLDVLVPKYLPSIPLDPYDGEPYRYRLSRGEVIEWPSDPPDPNARAMPPMGGQPGAVPAAVQPPTRKIPAGQGVLWCVGEDKVDDGGHRQGRSPKGETTPGEDVIFLVPQPPKAK